jgi:hypothetical protein
MNYYRLFGGIYCLSLQGAEDRYSIFVRHSTSSFHRRGYKSASKLLLDLFSRLHLQLTYRICRVHFRKLIVAHAFPSSYRSGHFISVFATVSHSILSEASVIQRICPCPTAVESILILLSSSKYKSSLSHPLKIVDSKIKWISRLLYACCLFRPSYLRPLFLRLFWKSLLSPLHGIANFSREIVHKERSDLWCRAEHHSRGRKLCSHSVDSQHFMETESSLPSSQELSTSTYPEPDHFSPQHSILSLKGPS